MTRSSVLLLVGGLAAFPWFAGRNALAAAAAPLRTTDFPFLGEAIARAGIAVVGAALVTAAAFAAGTLFLKAIRAQHDSRVEWAVYSLATGFGAVSYACLLLAAAGLYRPRNVALLISLALLAGALRGGPALRGQVVSEKDSGSPFAWERAWILLSAVALAFALLAALAPEKEYDALWYHLQLPRLWLDTGRLVDIVEEYVSLYPQTWELVFGAGMVMGGIVAAKLLHFGCLLLLATLVYVAARRYFPRAPAWMAVALLVTTPTVLWEASTAYVDLALALHAGAGCYALVRYDETEHTPWGILAGVQFGLAAATKHLGLVLIAIAMLAYIAARWRRGTPVPAITRAVALVVLVSVVFPLPWYVRNWTASGNPVFPEFFSVFGASPAERWDERTEEGLAAFKAHFGQGRTWDRLLALPWDVSVHGARFGGSLGPMFLLLIPALGFAGGAAGVRWLALGTFAYVAVWASPISSFQMRFLVPVVPALALLAAEAHARLSASVARAGRRASPMLSGAVVLLTAMNLPPFVTLHETDRVEWNGWLTHVLRQPPAAVVVGRESQHAYLAREVPSYAAWQYINAHAPADARVLAFSGGDHLYSRRARLSHDATIASPAAWGATAADTDAAIAALRRLRITHVLFDRRALDTREGALLALKAPRIQGACAVRHEDGRYWVCELDYKRLKR